MKKFWAFVTIVSTIFMVFDLFNKNIEVSNAWSPAPPQGADSAVLCMTIKNQTDDKDSLTGVTTDVSGHASIHGVVYDNGNQKVTDGQPLDLVAGQELLMRPDSTHIVLTGLRRIWVKGEKIHLVLTFAKKGVIEEDAVMQDAASTAYVE